MLLTIVSQQFHLGVYADEERIQYLVRITRSEPRPHVVDIKWLRDTLSHFFQGDKDDESMEQLRSAEVRFMELLKDDVSPFVAFKEIISTTALAQEMDTRHATMGGINEYISTLFTIADPTNHLKAEVKEAADRRKLEEIKKLMAINQKEETGGSPASKAEQVVDVVGQGHEGKVEQSPAREEKETDGNIKSETQLSVDDVDSQDVKPQQSG